MDYYTPNPINFSPLFCVRPLSSFSLQSSRKNSTGDEAPTVPHSPFDHQNNRAFRHHRDHQIPISVPLSRPPNPNRFPPTPLKP